MSFEFLVVGIYGLLIGSFLNVVILRLPEGEGLVFKRSHCTKCNKLINWYENLPVLSYILLRGRCSGCKQSISPRYPFVELLACFGTLWTYNLVSPSLMGEWINFCLLLLFLYILICHFFIDLDHHILPDSLNILLLLVAIIFVSLNYYWKFWLFGGLFGFGSTFLITYFFYKFRGKIGLGGGDIKLYGILGLMLGPVGIFQNIFLSSLLGIIVIGFMIGIGKMKKDEPIAFGPSIIIIAIIQIYFDSYFTSLINNLAL